MSNEWIDQPTMQDVAKSQAQGWEIEHRENSGSWFKWLGFSWQSNWEFRAREPMPAMKKVKQICFFSASGLRYDVLENSEQHMAISPRVMGWFRVPSEDKMVEVPA